MRAFGINYDTGFVSAGSTTHEPVEPETVRRDMRVIREELHCDAVRAQSHICMICNTIRRYARR